MIAILDYGIGNVSSIRNMMKKIGAIAVVTNDQFIIQKATKLILPGVGHFDYCMQQLRKAAFYDLLLEKVLIQKTPVMGVCVGCQMLMESSEEGSETGLGWIKGRVVRFKQHNFSGILKVPQMGWNDVQPLNNTRLYDDIEEPRFYFVHSYHVICDNDENISATSYFGYQFAASVTNKHIMGVQFHPEKSHKFGMKLYNNFVKYY